MELLLTLVYRHLVVEVPQSLVLLGVGGVGSVVAVGVVAIRADASVATVLGNHVLRVFLCLLVALLFLLLFERLYHAVNGSVACLLVGFGKHLQ